MAANLTDHIWRLEELFKFKPPHTPIAGEYQEYAGCEGIFSAGSLIFRSVCQAYTYILILFRGHYKICIAYSVFLKKH